MRTYVEQPQIIGRDIEGLARPLAKSLIIQWTLHDITLPRDNPQRQYSGRGGRDETPRTQEPVKGEVYGDHPQPDLTIE